MRILTWNINAIKSVYGYMPWCETGIRTMEGLCEGLNAEIICLQEHKTREDMLDKTTACPGPFDSFWTFPRLRKGYSGVCTYVDSRCCVPLKAEEGITGITLNSPYSVMKPPWSNAEKIGGYPEVDQVQYLDFEGEGPFDVKSLDWEGRAVVLDFGLFVLFNLYCPNETNEQRRPYKLNFHHALEARVANLRAQGREVIVAGDINVMRAPIDSGEGGIKVKSSDHYAHPARVWFNNWISPKGPMTDVVREFWPEREGMFTCWDTKKDCRPSNYGARIDYILVTPGLKQWLKGGDIMPNIHGSDHCPVYIDLHDSIQVEGQGTVHLRDVLNPANRPEPTFTIHPTPGPQRTVPEPPRFATKHWNQFSGKQRSMKDFFGKKAVFGSEPSPGLLPSPVPPTPTPGSEVPASPLGEVILPDGFAPPLCSARSAFDELDAKVEASPVKPLPCPASNPATQSTQGTAIEMCGDSDPESVAGPSTQSASPSAPPLKRPKLTNATSSSSKLNNATASSSKSSNSATPSSKNGKPVPGGQMTLSSFFKKPTPPPTVPTVRKVPKHSEPPPSPNTIEKDALMAQSLVEEDAERAKTAASKNKTAASAWGEIMARKIPPKCQVHGKPTKDFISGVKGPNKGKRFWICSVPVGPGYDSGRTTRAREDVDPKYRCDFFMWDEDNHQKQSVGKAVDWVQSKKRRSVGGE